jgi:hypothetical protein
MLCQAIYYTLKLRRIKFYMNSLTEAMLDEHPSGYSEK